MKRTFILIALFLLFIALPFTSVHAAPLAQDGVSQNPLGDLMTTFSSLTGVAMLIAAIVNSLKISGVVKDGQASSWSAGLNLVALAALFIAQEFGYGSIVPSVDSSANAWASLVSVIFAFVWQLYASRKTHDLVLAGLPVIGKTFSAKQAGETVSSISVG